MKKNIEVLIDSSNSYVYLDNNDLGISGENLQGELVFKFIDDKFVDGIGWLEIDKPNSETKEYVELTKNENTYSIPILSSLLTQIGEIKFQLRITENENAIGIPVFKSKRFYLTVEEAINATETIPQQYDVWIDVANEKILEVNNAIQEVNNLDIDIEENIITITKKDGSKKSQNVKGEPGTPGKDGINGTNGKDYVITQEDYKEIENQVKTDIQPTIENIENIAENAEVIARGRATGYVFDTVAELDLWLQNQDNVSKLVLGDNLYVRALGVPDYWWDGTQKQVLEAEKPNLTEYAKKEQFVTLTQEEYDALTEKSANT